MASVSQAKPAVLTPDGQKPRSPLADAMFQFRRNRLAMISLTFIVFMLFIAITADFWKAVGVIEDPIKPHHPTGASVAGNTNIGPEPPMTCATDNAPGTPQYCFVFGADDQHRDILSRLVYGSRVSFAVAIVGSVLTIGIGLIYGVIAGYFGGAIDNIMMRIVDFLMGFPDLVVIILIQVYLTSLRIAEDQLDPFLKQMVNIDRAFGGLFFVFVAIGLLGWIGIARMIRGQVLSYKRMEFIEAAHAVGASDRRIIFVHLLPNVVSPLIVISAISIPGFIFTEAGLSFLQLGVRAPTPSWGAMLSIPERAGTYIQYPYLILVPSIALTLLTLAFNYVGEGLRDALDPKFKVR